MCISAYSMRFELPCMFLTLYACCLCLTQLVGCGSSTLLL